MQDNFFARLGTESDDYLTSFLTQMQKGIYIKLRQIWRQYKQLPFGNGQGYMNILSSTCWPTYVTAYNGGETSYLEVVSVRDWELYEENQEG